MPNAAIDEFFDTNITAIDHTENKNTRKRKKVKITESAVEGFTIIGGEDFDKKQKVTRYIKSCILTLVCKSHN